MATRRRNTETQNNQFNSSQFNLAAIDNTLLDLKFYIGEQQAEKFDRLIKHLTAEAQKDYGYSMAYVIEYRKEYTFETLTKEESQLSNEKAKKV